MHLNKNHTFSRRALAMLLTLTLCLSLVPSAFAAQQNSYHDPAEHWMQASNRTNELDVNSVVTRETFKCGECGKVCGMAAAVQRAAHISFHAGGGSADGYSGCQ